MKKFLISKTRRLRSTPFTSRLEKYGVGGYTVYNHMLLPTFFQSVESEYEHLKKHVQLWDVTVQRQIEVNGKDSYKLIQLMTCRDLSKAKINRCYYVPLIDKEGNMVNDPLILKIEDDAVAEALDKMLKLLAPKNSDKSRSRRLRRSSKPQAQDMRE